jgi:hypothetical protein
MLSTCNYVTVAGVTEVPWISLHQPWYRHNHFAVFLWSNLHQHFAYMFPGRHIPATQSLYLLVWFSRNTDVDASHSMSLMDSRKSSVKPFKESVKLTDISYSYEINKFIK